MSMLLLSFLNDVECTLQGGSTGTQGEAWETARSIDYYSGLARLVINAKTDTTARQTLGSMHLQVFNLPDGAPCLKVFLSWSGSHSEVIHAIFPKPGMDWKAEAQRVALLWLDGRSNSSDAAASHEGLAATG